MASTKPRTGAKVTAEERRLSATEARDFTKPPDRPDPRLVNLTERGRAPREGKWLP